MSTANEHSLKRVIDLLGRNTDARKHFLMESKPIVDILRLKNNNQECLHSKRQLSARLVTIQQAEEARIREDYAQLLGIINNHRSCLEHVPALFAHQIATIADTAWSYSLYLYLCVMTMIALPPIVQQEITYIIALYNSYQDTNPLNITIGALVVLISIVQAEMVLIIRVLANSVNKTFPTTCSIVPTQIETLFLRFVAIVRSYIGTDEPYFFTKKQKRLLAAYRTTSKDCKIVTNSSANSSALLELLERYGSVHEPAAVVEIETIPKVEENAEKSHIDTASNVYIRTHDTSVKHNQIKRAFNKQSTDFKIKETSTYRQKSKVFKYPAPPDIEANIKRTQIGPPLKLLSMTSIFIFPSGYGPVDLMYKGYRVGIQEMFGLTKAAFGAAMARTSYKVPDGEVESFGSDTSLTPPIPMASTMDQELLHTTLSHKRPSLDISLLAKAQVSWVQNRWINLASCDPSDLQLLCLEQTMMSTIEDSLENKQLDIEQIRQSITEWGDRCIQIALKAPLPKTWTPILTQDGLYVRFLDNKTGTIFNVNPEVKEIQKRIDIQYKLLEKCVRIHKNSEIMRDYELVKRFISTRFISTDLCKNTSTLFKDLVEELNGLTTQIGHIITLWAPLYNTSDINFTAEHHNLDDRCDSGIRFNL